MDAAGSGGAAAASKSFSCVSECECENNPENWNTCVTCEKQMCDFADSEHGWTYVELAEKWLCTDCVPENCNLCDEALDGDDNLVAVKGVPVHRWCAYKAAAHNRISWDDAAPIGNKDDEGYDILSINPCCAGCEPSVLRLNLDDMGAWLTGWTEDKTPLCESCRE